MKKKGHWNPKGWDPIDHNEVVADERGFRRSATFHKAWKGDKDWHWFGMRPLGMFLRRSAYRAK